MKFRDIVLTSVVIAAALLMYVIIPRQLKHAQNRKRSDFLYRNARAAYDHVAAIKDADESQFEPAYYEARDAIDAQQKFDDLHALSKADHEAADAAMGHLRNCLTALAIRRSPEVSQATRVQMDQQIEHCAIDGTPGTAATKK